MTPITDFVEGQREIHPDACPACGGVTYVERRGPHVKWACPKCGHIKFLAQKWQAFVVPFGKHKGEVLGDLAKSRPDYVRWMAENCSQPIVKRRFAEACDAGDNPAVVE
jgi:ribosomal protein L37AE/L43A